jgi:DNA-binding LytR/AlgR family response regulator
MIIKCLAIDDEPLALSVLEGYISRTPFLEHCGSFTNPVEGLAYLKENQVDLIFLDIRMPDVSGFDILSELQPRPLVVFTTAYPDYAVEGFRADAIDYLLKPIEYADFLKAVNKAGEWLKYKTSKTPVVKSDSNFLFIRSEYKIIRINFEDIRYIQSLSSYVKIYLLTGKPILSLLSLKSLEAKLPEALFMRVHKSFIVNLKKINVIERNEILYDDGVVIPVSAPYRESFQRFIDSNFLS